MHTFRTKLALVWLLTAAASAQPAPVMVEHGVYTVHLLLHAIGSEEYSVTEADLSHRELKTMLTTSDRGMKRTSTSTLNMGPALTPIHFRQSTTASGVESIAETDFSGALVKIVDATGSRTAQRPGIGFVGSAGMPAAVEMMMMRYWEAHGRPARLPVLRGSDQALPIEIRAVGHEALPSHGKLVRLTRYTVANLVFGREVLWMNDSNRMAAVMTFAGGLPQETVLDEYEDMLGGLFHSGVRQELLELADLSSRLKPEALGTYAIVGARLIDGTGRTPVEHATVIVRNGRIAAAGTGVTVPPGMRVIHEDGRSLLPGLWEMHSHYSGVEFGPALLSAGITTARDCGGEREFLVSVRRAIDKGALGPRLLLAGLVDSGGPLAFGADDVETPAEGKETVDGYADAGFEQIKVYTQIKPAVLKAISAEAHRRGLTVTGHVPSAVDTIQGIEDGMDQINHLQFITREMTDHGNKTFDPHSGQAQKLLSLLRARHIVVDPTLGWGEMASHPKGTVASNFEPGLKVAPWTLTSRFESMGSAGPAAASFDQRMKLNRQVVGELYKAGVPIVAGSDTNLLGYGLDRELELYVQSGMTPLDAIRTATSVPAQVMKQDADSGTVEVGKRADMVIVEGDPSTHISDLRRVVSVVTGGSMYSSKSLGESVGFRRQ